MKIIIIFSLIVLSFSLQISKLEPSYENAKEIYDFFKAKGWTVNAICGMLGNMHWESDGIQPDINEMGGSGYGLVQWTPGTILKNWADENGLDYRTINTQCQRIQWEFDNGQQYYKKKCSYTNFRAFSKSKDSAEKLAECFMTEYERPVMATAHLEERKKYANYWYTHFANNSPLIFTYQVKTSDGEISAEIQNDNVYAGTKGKEITDISIKVNKGTVSYQIHVIEDDKWLPYINNGFAGNEKPIDMIRIIHDEMKPFYRVSMLNYNFFEWQYGDLEDKDKGYHGYAGLKNNKIDRLQIIPCRPENSNNNELLNDDEFKCIYPESQDFEKYIGFNIGLIYLILVIILL